MKKTASRGLQQRLEACLAEVEKRFPPSREAVIPLLQAVQAELKYLPPEAMKRIAAHVGMSDAAVMGIATFYAQFHFEAPGKHRITICRGTACHVRGSGRLQEDLCSYYGLAPGKTTADGMFTLETVACFGSCALAPVMVVDGKVYGRQTTASARETVERVRRQKAGGRA
jgi:NADH:ubiquinone oxidoreductase subunit E